MTDKSVYAWVDDLGLSGKFTTPSAPMMREKALDEYIFSEGVPIAECFHHGWYATKMKPCLWLSEFEKLLIKNTDAWFYERHPIECATSISKEKLRQFDFLQVIMSVPTVSERVYRRMLEICPNDFEGFEITIQTPTGVVEGYRLINITQLIFGAMDLEKSIIRSVKWEETPQGDEMRIIETQDVQKMYEEVAAGTRDKKDVIGVCTGQPTYLSLVPGAMKNHLIGRLAESPRVCMFSQELIDEFKAMNTKGFNYMPLEEKNNCLYGRGDR